MRSACTFVALLMMLPAGAAHAAERLPGLEAESAPVTVSGLSSGAYMAVQFHVAHSAIVRGAAAIAGGPYYCAQGNAWVALNHCMRPARWAPVPAVEFLAQQTRIFARAGAIDPVERVAGARIWLLAGAKDSTVSPEVVQALRRYYLALDPGAQIAFVGDLPAGHAMVTKGRGNACESSEPPFINDCGYDSAGALLAHLLGPLAPPAGPLHGRLIEFDQREFTRGPPYRIGMADSGYAYVPAVCGHERGRVHVAFHGCRQAAESIGERFVREAGYNDWADGNRLIVLYPQASASWLGPFNPRGCWDWWGYTGANYATRQAPQMHAVMAMLERLAGRGSTRGR